MSAIRYPLGCHGGSGQIASPYFVDGRIVSNKRCCKHSVARKQRCYLTFRLLVDPVATTLWLALLCLQGALSGLGHSLIHADMETRRTIERGHNWTDKS